jgi:poly(3-hydroxyalkanoate) synthetase
MITKFRTGGFGRQLIEAVEVERETDSSVWIKGNRNAKITSYHKYWDSWEEAHAYLLERADRSLQDARRALERAQGEYGNIKGMKAV